MFASLNLPPPLEKILRARMTAADGAAALKHGLLHACQSVSSDARTAGFIHTQSATVFHDRSVVVCVSSSTNRYSLRHPHQHSSTLSRSLIGHDKCHHLSVSSQQYVHEINYISAIIHELMRLTAGADPQGGCDEGMPPQLDDQMLWLFH